MTTYELTRMVSTEGEVRDSLKIMESKYINSMTLNRNFTPEQVKEMYSNVIPKKTNVGLSVDHTSFKLPEIGRQESRD